MTKINFGGKEDTRKDKTLTPIPSRKINPSSRSSFLRGSKPLIGDIYAN